MSMDAVPLSVSCFCLLLCLPKLAASLQQNPYSIAKSSLLYFGSYLMTDTGNTGE